MTELRRSRPARQAARATGVSEAEALEGLDGIVLIVLEDDLTNDADARETFLFAVNQCLRFAGGVGASASDRSLVAAAEGLAAAITGSRLTTADPDVTLVVGTAVRHDRPTITVTSEGWLARLATSSSEVKALPRAPQTPNVLGALAAACLGVAQVFHHLAGLSLNDNPVELSLWDFATGPVGSLDPGPPLPSRITIDALLIGCGGVMHGFAYALARLPVVGCARAVDRQRLHPENLGPYVLATLANLGLKKADLIKATLPAIDVTSYDEDFYPLFTTRLDRGHISLPPLVVAGLDDVPPRHIVQRLWPGLLLDMGASGETSQLLVRPLGGEGACVLELLDLAPGVVDAEGAELDRLAAESGLATELIRDAMDKPITPADVANAPAALRADMESARQRGEVRCGFVRRRALNHERGNPGFVAAVPFVVAFSGLAACAALVKNQMDRLPLWSRYQFSFASLRGRTTRTVAAADCECRRISSLESVDATSSR